MTQTDILRFLILRSLGNFLLLIALYGVFATFGPGLWYELKFEIMQLRGVTFVVNAEPNAAREPKNMLNDKDIKGKRQKVTAINQSQPGFAAILAGNKEQFMTPIDPMFSILIPKLGIDEKVFPNVDPNNPNAYLPILLKGVAQAKGSVFPGDPGITYLFAHSADNWWDIGRYNAIFYTLYNLSVGDKIVLFYQDRRYDYVVNQQIISDPQDITLLTSQHTGPQQLVLQTCWPLGTSFKRLYIIAVPKK